MKAAEVVLLAADPADRERYLAAHPRVKPEDLRQVTSLEALMEGRWIHPRAKVVTMGASFTDVKGMYEALRGKGWPGQVRCFTAS